MIYKTWKNALVLLKTLWPHIHFIWSQLETPNWTCPQKITAVPLCWVCKANKTHTRATEFFSWTQERVVKYETKMAWCTILKHNKCFKRFRKLVNLCQSRILARNSEFSRAWNWIALRTQEISVSDPDDCSCIEIALSEESNKTTSDSEV